MSLFGRVRRAVREDEAARAQVAQAALPGLLEFVPACSPTMSAPRHLAPYASVLQRAPGADLRAALSAPPQHGKTEVTLHALVWWLLQDPTRRHAYATYSAERAQRVSRRAAWIAQRAGLHYDGTLNLWRTPQGGQIIWTSVAGPTGGGALTGDPVDGVLVIDDPIKGRKEAESALVREAFRDWYHGTATSRLHPGSSVIAIATRWHDDDPIGWLVKEQGYEAINLKAIADDERPVGDDRAPGAALWPEQRPLSMLLQRQRENAWSFAALYQGQPRPRGGTLFREPTYYDRAPDVYTVTMGIDLSYTAKTRADFSVLVELACCGDDLYVLDVIRRQVEAPEFAMLLAQKSRQRPGCSLYFYASGTEKGTAQFLVSRNIPVKVINPAGRDKMTRAIATSALWNTGKIRIPSGAPWTETLVDEICSFTGVHDVHDDQLDALVAAVDMAIVAAGRSGAPRILSAGSHLTKTLPRDDHNDRRWTRRR